MNIGEISKMSVIERLQMMEMLWDSLTHETNDLQPPGWHEEILSAIKNKIKNGQAKFIPLEALKAKHAR
jgi:putative addiction module component (TIGR02574 family)